MAENVAVKRKYSVMYNDELYTALTCSICLDWFKNPKQMPNCSHTFCAECLETLVATNSAGIYVDCPNCRTHNFILNGGVKSLSTNIVAQQLVEKVNLETWAAENDGPSPVASAENKDKCTHLFSNNRQNCAHCNKRFCERCLSEHVKNVHAKMIERDDLCKKRLATLDMRGYEERLNASVEKMRGQLDNRMAIIQAALKAEHDRIMAEAASIANREIGKARDAIHQVKESLRQTNELNAHPVSAEEIAKFDSEIAKREKMVEDTSKQMNKPLDLVVEGDLSFIGNIIMRWKVGISKQSSPLVLVPSSVEEVVVEDHVGETVVSSDVMFEEARQEEMATTRAFYDQMYLVTTAATKDAFGGPIRLPRRICSLNGDRVALIHEMNRISILQWNGRILSTLKVFDPRKSKTELFLQDFAYDHPSSQLFAIVDGGTLIGTIQLSATSNRIPECVLPGIFARKGANSFHGIAVSSSKQEVYVGEGSMVAVYSLVERTKLRNFGTNVAEPTVVSCFGDDTIPCRIFFSSNSGDTLGFIERSDLSVKTVATKGTGIGEVHQLYGISFDHKGNLLVADAKNSRIQVFFSNLTALTSFGSLETTAESSQGSSGSSQKNTKARLKPFGVAVMVSSSNQTLRIVVPDYAGHRVCFFESKKLEQ